MHLSLKSNLVVGSSIKIFLIISCFTPRSKFNIRRKKILRVSLTSNIKDNSFEFFFQVRNIFNRLILRFVLIMLQRCIHEHFFHLSTLMKKILSLLRLFICVFRLSVVKYYITSHLLSVSSFSTTKFSNSFSLRGVPLA